MLDSLAKVFSLIDSPTFWTSPYLWVGKILLGVLLTWLAVCLLCRLLAKLAALLNEDTNPWAAICVVTAERPMKWLVWIVGLSLAVDVAGEATNSELMDMIPLLRSVAVNFVLAWFLLRLSRRLESCLQDSRYISKPMDPTTVAAIGKLLRATIVVLATLIILQTLGISVSGIMALGGVGGLAVGFAAKDLLANFFGGLIVYLDKPFKVGDWVRSPDQEIEGVVEAIGWRITCIRTFDKRPLYIPNSTFTRISVENPSRMSNRRIYETIGIRYCDADKMAAIVDEVKSMLLSHPEIDTRQTLIVNFNGFASSSLDFFVYTFTKTTDWIKFHEIKQDILLRILAIVESQGAETAFPTSTLHFADGLPLPSAAVESPSAN